MVVGECEGFVAKMRSTNETLIITIPKNVVDFGGYKDGDLIKVLIKKQDKE